MEPDFEPKIIAFLCNWCTYTGADLAGTSRLQYPPNVRIIRLMCSGAVDPMYVLKADLAGADGMLNWRLPPGRLPLPGRQLQSPPAGGRSQGNPEGDRLRRRTHLAALDQRQ